MKFLWVESILCVLGFFIICIISCRSSVTSAANIWLIAAAAGAVPPLLQTCGAYDRCTGKGKEILSLICFPQSGEPSVMHSSPKTFSFHRIKIWSHQTVRSSLLPIWLSHHLRARLRLVFRPPFTDKTRRSGDFDSSLWAGASEFPAGPSDPGRGITKLFYGPLSTQPGWAFQSFQPPALPSLVRS